MIESIHSYRGYVFTIQYQSRTPAYSVDFPDIPQIVTSSDTLSGAFANACEALDLHLESIQKLGLTPPPAHHRLVVEAA